MRYFAMILVLMFTISCTSAGSVQSGLIAENLDVMESTMENYRAAGLLSEASWASFATKVAMVRVELTEDETEATDISSEIRALTADYEAVIATDTRVSKQRREDLLRTSKSLNQLIEAAVDSRGLF